MDKSAGTRFGTLTVASYWIEYLLDAALHAGCDLSSDLVRLGVSDEDLESPGARISLETEHSLLLSAIEQTGDRYFGLHMGERIRPRFMGELGYASMSSANLGQAIELAIPYLRLTTEFARMESCWENDHLILKWITPFGDLPAARHRVEAYFAACIVFGRWIIGNDGHPVEILFAHPGPANTEEYARVFQCPVRFSQSRDAIVISRRVLDLPLRDADADVHRVMRNRVQQAMSQFQARDSLLDAVRAEIRKLLTMTTPQLENVADAMGIKPWTLRRRLRAEDADFTALLDEERKALAVDWLLNTDRAVSQIASDLGYSEQSAFNRAFRRWFDCTPLAYRQQTGRPHDHQL